MENIGSTPCVVTGILLLAGISDAYSQEWPQRRVPHRDSAVRGIEYADRPAEKTMQWIVKAVRSDAIPALPGNNRYAFTGQGKDGGFAAIVDTGSVMMVLRNNTHFFVYDPHRRE